ncbi:MAG TPA: DUF6212 domain-containing protein [Bryobacteraceae bacterium]|jgi:hypothetical protein
MNRTTLAYSLFGSGALMILGSSDSHLASDLAALTGIPVVLFDEASGFQSLSGEQASLDEFSSPPTSSCVFVAQSSAGREQLRALSAWWAGAGGLPAPMIEPMDGEPGLANLGLAVMRAMLGHFKEMNRRVTQSNVDLHDQILSLRTQVETADALIAELKSKAIPGKPWIVAFLEPAGEIWAPEDKGNVAVFGFPHQLRGLSQLDLHFRRSAGSSGSLSVQLSSIENEGWLGEWRMPYDQVEEWQRFLLPAASFSSNNYLKITIQWSTLAGPAPALSLSNHRIEMNGPGGIDHPPDSTRLPALRLYKAIAGFVQPAPHWVQGTEGRD